MECHNCGDDFHPMGLSKHWIFGTECDYPDLTEHELDMFRGILMSDGNVDNTHTHSRISIDMIAEEYLELLYNNFKPLFNPPRMIRTAEESAETARSVGLNKDAKAENYSPVYRIRTRSMPCFDRFYSWYDSGEKVWPEFTITPTVLKHWYCGDGNLHHHGSIRISMDNEVDNIEKVKRMFEGSPIPEPSFYQRDEKLTARFTVSDSKDIFTMMREPPKGFEYKWEN